MDAAAYRLHIALAHAAVILWQMYSAITAFRTGDRLAHLLTGLGAENGPGVSFFLATYRWWLVVPILFAVLAGAALKRLETKPMFSLAVFGASLIVALALNILWREAWFGPMFNLIRQVG
jgi:hypothetical protein